MTQSDDDELPRPRVPQDSVISDDAADEDSVDTIPDDPLYENPEKLTQRLSDSAFDAVSLAGPITADCVIDISPTGCTLAATYQPDADDDHLENVCSLANSDTCVQTIGSQKVDDRYVPRRLEFEKTFQFESEVTSVDDLRAELQEIFGPGISLTTDESSSPF